MRYEAPSTYDDDLVSAGRVVLTLFWMLTLPLAVVIGLVFGCVMGAVRGFQYATSMVWHTWTIAPD